MSSHLLMVNPRQVVRALVFALLLSLLSAASVSMAYGQQFTLTVSSNPSPPAVDPGGSSTATLNIAAGSSDNPVSFNAIPCTVTPVQATGTPECSVSPDSVTPPGQTFLTISTFGGTGGATPPGLYTITVTGSNGSASQAVTLTLNVVNVTENYTLSVSPATATPSPVPAGNVSTTVVTVFPIANYTGSVTLACLSVAPVVAAAPYCSFNPATVQVTSGFAPTSTLTITTLGPVPVTRLRNRQILCALLLLVPGLVFVGLGKTGAQGKNLLRTLLLMAVAGGLLLLPACNSTPITNSPNGEITPKNTYTFTLTATDQTGAGPSNGTTCPVGQTCNQATVTLAVN